MAGTCAIITLVCCSNATKLLLPNLLSEWNIFGKLKLHSLWNFDLVSSLNALHLNWDSTLDFILFQMKWQLGKSHFVDKTCVKRKTFLIKIPWRELIFPLTLPEHVRTWSNTIVTILVFRLFPIYMMQAQVRFSSESTIHVHRRTWKTWKTAADITTNRIRTEWDFSKINLTIQWMRHFALSCSIFLELLTELRRKHW